jgi:phosphotransferase system enzyme I (PtsI)
MALVARVIHAAKTLGKSVTVCGEMAADVRGARLLRDLGVDGLSVAPARVAEIKLALLEP